MPDIKQLLDKIKVPYAKEAKKKISEKLGETFGPESKITKAGEVAADIIIPEDIVDAAMLAMPGGSLLKAGKSLGKVAKTAKAADKAEDVAKTGKTIEKTVDNGTTVVEISDKPARTINYQDIAKAEKSAADAARKKADEEAITYSYDKFGNITSKSPKK